MSISAPYSAKGSGDTLTAADANALSTDVQAALDKRSGQTDTFQCTVTASGNGRIIGPYLAGADSDQTYALSTGISIINARAITATRNYTLSTTGAASGDRVHVIGGAQNCVVKDGFDGSTMLTVGTGTTATTPDGVFVFNGTRWIATGFTSATGSGALVYGTAPTLGGTVTYSGTGAVSSNDAKGTETDTNPVHVQTTDATVTTLDSFTLASGTALLVSWNVTAIKSDSTQAAGYLVSATFRNNAGTVAAVGSVQVIAMEDDAAWDCTIDNSGTTIRLRITGKASTTIQWSAVCSRLTVIP